TIAGKPGGRGRGAGAGDIGDGVRGIGGDPAHAAIALVADVDVSVRVDDHRVDEVEPGRPGGTAVADVTWRLLAGDDVHVQRGGIEHLDFVVVPGRQITAPV